MDAPAKRAPKRTEYDLSALFAENMMREVKSRRWSMKEFGRKTGLSSRTLSDIRDLRYTATLSSVQKVASAFHLPAHTLLMPAVR